MDTPLATADASFIGHESAAPMAEQSGHAGCLGDADGDGFADIVIGAPGHGDGDGSTGRAYMVAGKADGWQMSQSLVSTDAHVDGELPDDRFGSAIACVGDVNGDGFGDTLISAHYNGENGPEAGQSYLFLGSSSIFDDPLEPFASFQGQDADDHAGTHVAGGGDVNGDGFADFLIRAGHNGEDCESLGAEVYLFFGWDGCDDLDGDGYEGCNEDCHDLDPDVNPAAVEVCDDHFDNDCDGLIDALDSECEEVVEDVERSTCRFGAAPPPRPTAIVVAACLLAIGAAARRFWPR